MNEFKNAPSYKILEDVQNQNQTYQRNDRMKFSLYSSWMEFYKAATYCSRSQAHSTKVLTNTATRMKFGRPPVDGVRKYFKKPLDEYFFLGRQWMKLEGSNNRIQFCLS